MRKTLLTATAIAALAFAVPALGDDATAPAGAATPPANADNAATAPSVNTQIASAPAFIDKQSDDQVLVSNIVGSTVFDTSDNDLGKVNDVVLDKDGKMTAVVIGVGGFLGIGEKNVAVPYDAITKTADKDGNPKLILNASADALNGAPEYMTVAMLKQQEEAKLREQQMLDQTAPSVPTN